MNNELVKVGHYIASRSYQSKLGGKGDNLTVTTVWKKTFEVSGAYMTVRPGFRTLKAAVEYAKECEAFNKKFPFECPRSAREIAKAKRLGLSVNN
jgi:hypothetical protein